MNITIARSKGDEAPSADPEIVWSAGDREAPLAELPASVACDVLVDFVPGTWYRLSDIAFAAVNTDPDPWIDVAIHVATSEGQVATTAGVGQRRAATLLLDAVLTLVTTLQVDGCWLRVD